MIVFVVGTLFIVTALVASAGAVLGYTLLIRGYRPVLPWTRRSIWVASGSSIVAAGILLALFVLGRYEFAYVYQYSSADLEMPCVLISDETDSIG